MASEWTTVRAADFIEFNPRLSLKKGVVATKVAMEKLQPFTKKIPAAELAEFAGGSKFCNGDTIMARITPCLENGKTAFVDFLKDGEIAFGSTEFIVMRARAGVSDPQFVYYLATSPAFRNIAIKSMVGSSGRQRVQQGVLDELELTVPPLGEQQKIGAFLAMLDLKIALNNKINDNLHELLQSVFLTKFRLSEESASVGTLSEICAYSKDRVAVSKLSVGNYYSTENMLPSKAGFVDAASLPTTPQTTKCNIGDVLVSNIRPYFKKIVFCQSEGGCSTDVLCFTPKSPSLSTYLFCTLYADSFFDFMAVGSKGTKMPRGDKQQIMTYPVVIPTEAELRDFDKVAQPILRQIHINSDENTYLAALRDTLLPKLMSGEIDVSKIDA